jgi:acetyl esterase
MNQVLNIELEAIDGPMEVRVYFPNRLRPAPPLIYLHGGGWTLLNLDTHDRIMREYAAASGWAVVGLDYPLAPETPFPGALRACASVIRSIVAMSEELGLLARRLAIGGDSSGANLALALAIALRTEGGPRIDGLILNYGVYDCDFERPSYTAFGLPPFTLSPEKMAWFWDQYCPLSNQRSHPLASPLRADLRGLSPIRLVTAGQDVLRDENVVLARKLIEAGNVLSVDHYPNAPHAFLEAIALDEAGGLAIARAADWLNDFAFGSERSNLRGLR